MRFKLIISILIISGLTFPLMTLDLPYFFTPLDKLSVDKSIPAIKSAVIYLADKMGLNKSELLNTIQCESSFRYNIKNPNSSALGLAQIIDGTWKEWGCEGDRLDPKDSLICMTEAFKKGLQRHWECYKPYLSS